MPFFEDYIDSGYYETSTKLKKSFFYLVYSTVGVSILPGVFLLYCVKTGLLSQTDTPKFVIACANS